MKSTDLVFSSLRLPSCPAQIWSDPTDEMTLLRVLVRLLSYWYAGVFHQHQLVADLGFYSERSIYMLKMVLNSCVKTFRCKAFWWLSLSLYTNPLASSRNCLIAIFVSNHQHPFLWSRSSPYLQSCFLYLFSVDASFFTKWINSGSLQRKIFWYFHWFGMFICIVISIRYYLWLVYVCMYVGR